MFYRLNVPYKEKDEAKAFGARWNPQEKFWYYEGELPDGLRRWYTEDQGTKNRTVQKQPVKKPVFERFEAPPEETAPIQYTEDFHDIFSDDPEWEHAGEDLPWDQFTDIFPEHPSQGSFPWEESASSFLWEQETEAGFSVFPEPDGSADNFPAFSGSGAANDLLGLTGAGVNLSRYRSVSEITNMIAESFSNTLEFRSIMVTGEVTDFSGHRGQHYYFSIKDQKSVLPCFMYENVALNALKFELKQGQQVAIIGSLDLYRRTGKCQLMVREIENVGDGAANLAYLMLKQKLEAEGLFDDIHKKAIPKHPAAVGIVTSKDGQAIRDIMQAAKERNPFVQLVLYHVNVQGKNAVSMIIEGIRTLDRMGLDTIIVGRGGGSDEELIVYNDEKLARTVFAAETPIISAVGHEGHHPLIDLVADLRVSTPTKAAHAAIPDVMADIRRIEQLKDSISFNMRKNLEYRQQRLQLLTARIRQCDPVTMLKEKQNRLSVLSELLHRNILTAFERRKHLFELLTTELNGLSPTAKLVKGFGYISHKERPVTSVTEVSAGDEIRIQISDGRIFATVTDTLKEESPVSKQEK